MKTEKLIEDIEVSESDDGNFYMIQDNDKGCISFHRKRVIAAADNDLRSSELTIGKLCKYIMIRQAGFSQNDVGP